MPFLAALLALTIGSATAAPDRPPAAVIDAADYPTLQAALDAVPEGGGMVLLPPGKFEISASLRLSRGDVRIKGAGAATQVVNLNEAGEPALLIQADGFPANPRARIWRVQIGNFRISGNPRSGDGVRFEGVHELFVQNMSIDRNGGHGIHTIRCEENPRIVSCNITYNGLAGLNLTDAHDIVVSGNQFEENQDGVRCIDSFNLNLTGNIIDDHLRHGVVIENTHSSVVSGNMIEQCKGIAMILDRDCVGFSITGNTLASDVDGGIDLRDAWGCSITGNNFTRVYHYSVRVGPNSGRIAISGNTFNNTYVGEGKIRFPVTHEDPDKIDDGSGVVITGASDMIVSGNLFSGITTPAVFASGGAQRLLVANNLVTGLNTRGGPSIQAFQLADARDSIVKDNLVPPNQTKTGK